MNREQLIEKAAYERYPDIEADPRSFPTGWSRESERKAFMAGAAFEQAHTPTDDEREALLTEADALVESWDHKGSWSSDSPVGLVMRLAAHLRRTVQGEPITEEQINAERERQVAKGYTPEHDRKHGIAHVLRYVLHYGSRGEHLKAYAMVEAALEIAPSVGVQGEPKLIECPHWSPGRVTMRKSCAACEAVQDEPQVMLRRANGSPKSNDEIRAEAAAIRDHVRALTGLTDAGLTELGGFQGEPTDAQADAAQKAFHEFTFGPDDDFLTPRRMGITRQAWKAALRAAFNETGEKR